MAVDCTLLDRLVHLPERHGSLRFGQNTYQIENTGLLRAKDYATALFDRELNLAAGAQPQAFANLFRDRHLTLASELCLERSQLRGNREVSGSPAFLDLPYSVATALKACQDVVLGAAGGLADIIHRCAFRSTEHPLSDLGSRPARLHVTFPYLLLYISILF